MYMIDGKLLVTLDPSWASFSSENSRGRKNFTLEELHALLADLGLLVPGQSWPPREYMFNLTGHFPKKILAKHGLLEFAAMRSNWKPKRVSPRLAADWEALRRKRTEVLVEGKVQEYGAVKVALLSA